MGQQIVVLVGGGHAHLEVIRRFSAQMQKKSGREILKMMLISPDQHSVYSGMVPGVIAGHYRLQEALINLPGLCAVHNTKWIQGAVIDANPRAKYLVLNDGRQINYDIVSFDTGSTTDTGGLSADATEYGVKPMLSLLQRWQSFVDTSTQNGGGTLLIAGGGVAGVELILAARHRLPHLQCYLVSRSELLKGHNTLARRKIKSILDQQDVTLIEHMDVVSVGQTAEYNSTWVQLSDRSTWVADFLLLATEAGAHRWLGSSGLPTTGSGYLPVGSTLQIKGFPGHFAVGDTAEFNPPLPKAGVYPVRQAPVLSYNLLAYAKREPLQHFQPQSRILNLIATGDRHAIASRGWLFCSGRWVWQWKNRIDQKFVRQYQS